MAERSQSTPAPTEPNSQTSLSNLSNAYDGCGQVQSKHNNLIMDIPIYYGTLVVSAADCTSTNAHAFAAACRSHVPRTNTRIAMAGEVIIR